MSDMDMAGLAFFDECTERVEEENGTYKIEIYVSMLTHMREILRNGFFIFLL